MSRKTLVYWHGIIGIPGKGPHYIEPYDSNRTIGQIIESMTINGLVERNKRVEIYKHRYGNINRYDEFDPYWSHNAKLSDYVNLMGGCDVGDIQLICIFLPK